MSIEEWRRETGQTPRPSKYHNVKENGRDSRKEYSHEQALIMAEKTGEIANLRTQVPFILIPAQKKKDGSMERSCKYIADFVYDKNGETVVEDVKSDFTRKLPLYILKRKLMLFVHGIEIKEV